MNEPTEPNPWENFDASTPEYVQGYLGQLRAEILYKIYGPSKVLAFRSSLASMDRSRIVNEMRGNEETALFLEGMQQAKKGKITPEERQNILTDYTELESLTTESEILAWGDRHNAKMEPEELAAAKEMTIHLMGLGRDQQQE